MPWLCALITPSDGTGLLLAQLEKMSDVTVRQDGLKEEKEELFTHSWIKCDIVTCESGVITKQQETRSFCWVCLQKLLILIQVVPSLSWIWMWLLTSLNFINCSTLDVWSPPNDEPQSDSCLYCFKMMFSPQFGLKQWFEGQESGGQKLLLVIGQANLLSIYTSRPPRGEPSPLASTPVCGECEPFVTLARGAIMKNNNKPLLEKSANERNTPEALPCLLPSQMQPVGRPFLPPHIHARAS